MPNENASDRLFPRKRDKLKKPMADWLLIKGGFLTSARLQCAALFVKSLHARILVGLFCFYGAKRQKKRQNYAECDYENGKALFSESSDFINPLEI